ncbi:MAG: peptide deformylase [Bacteroidetes bacterium]|nr:MAG: peptide deformylase [Bacteroidota bacterium]
MIYPIVAYGDPILRKPAQEISNDFSTNLSEIIQNMFETMHHSEGVGLAAPQVGLSLRLFVVDGTSMEEDEAGMKDFVKTFINPTLLEEKGEEWAMTEGCLSIPNIREDVSRKKTLKLRYFDEHWNEHIEEFTGLKARIIQHEYDHLEGVLFIDYLSNLKKRLLQNKLKNISKGKVDTDYKMRFPAASARR